LVLLPSAWLCRVRCHLGLAVGERCSRR